MGLLLHTVCENPIAQGINSYLFEPLGQLFLRGIFMVVVPMVMSGLIVGVYQLTSHHGLAKVAQKTLFFTLLASSASVLIGVGMVNIIRPGEGIQIPQITESAASNLQKIQKNVSESKPALQAILEIIPKNPIESASKAFDGEMLALMFFSLVFGVALCKQNKSNQPPKWIALFEECYETCMQIVEWVMKLAPFAVFALVFQSTFKYGHQILFSLGLYHFVVVVIIAIVLFLF